ncbi:MAG TPA: PDZ domain-containing protein [Candidatus Aminicenantes bacterium]|nr:PDZ domain-containing protein [Acidobacteriota bacterium]HOF82916.1 PDZ domain-containing protein [Candidatus Aminicenantes bacterium]MDW3227077.1 PDZ domain-containing protein [Acidobacteriota bacterium]HOS11328.1 PDZ domain-containing protein [Candidatus Aminicenantes bacterium]HOU48478.1 PDZ domain-containing protein [Candidatus Aminicenantes bacterium]
MRIGTRCAAALLAAFVSLGFGIDIRDTRMMTQPAVGKSGLAFHYANDLWAADLDGKNVRRLTSDLGIESNPAFSPDGGLIAFSAQYDGNTDVYIVPAAGGVPRRLTWHPGADIVQGFTPDGKAVLFTSARQVFTGRYQQLFTVPVEGGFPEKLRIPNAFRAVYSPDGKKMATNPLSDSFLQWKHYRGGTNSTIWIINLDDLSYEKIPQPEGRCNDPGPMWIGDMIYFRSDRDGEFNIYSYDPRTREIKALTRHEDFPVLSASAGDGRIIYEQAGFLHLLDPVSGASTRLQIGIATDAAELRERTAKGAKWIRNGELSPSGARAVFEFRGEIVTVPAEKGDPRNLTRTPGAHERSPVWSPDGKSIAYFSDASGEYALEVRSQDGKGTPRSYALAGSGFYETPVWSPDGRRIAFHDNARAIYVLDLEKGDIKKIGADYQLGGRKSPSAWSPDGKWLAYTLGTASYFQRVFVYSVAQDKSFPVSDGLSEAYRPVFDASGKFLYFFASTDAGPINQWFDLSKFDARLTSSIYIVSLAKDTANPLARESDEETGLPAKPVPGVATKEAAAPAAPAGPAPAAEVKIDFDGIGRRIVAVPVPPGSYDILKAGEAGQIYYLESPPDIGSPAAARGGLLHRYDFKSRKDEVLLTGVFQYTLSFDCKKILYSGPSETFFLTALQPKPAAGQGQLQVGEIGVPVVPEEEWAQIFAEAWRINRDYFYADNMHGADWEAMRKKYEVFLPDLSCRADLNRLIQWMCSELGVGHHRVGGGDFLAANRAVPGGLLGADYAVENGRYRIKRIYGGLNWNPDLRSPLTEPGLNVAEGDYLLAVDGRELRAPADNLFALFENKAGKFVELKVGPLPDGRGARTVRAVPIENELALRNRDWVEGNLKKVEKATGGRVAYVYVPNTSYQGFAYFKRYFYPQADKEAVIVDERFNGGGLIADYYIDHLRRPEISYWNMRHGADMKAPGASIQGPKVMLIDETAGSGGDLLPWMFRKFKIGPLVGKRTWGGLVGTLGFPVLMDGGYVTAPNLAIWTEDGWIVENEGVPPDVEVEQDPAAVAAGGDPQLERAIAIVMEELAKSPAKKPVRPPYPIRGNRK